MVKIVRLTSSTYGTSQATMTGRPRVIIVGAASLACTDSATTHYFQSSRLIGPNSARHFFNHASLISRRFVCLASLLALSPSSLLAQGIPTPLDTVRVTSRTGTALVAPTRSVETITREDLDRRAGQTVADILTFALGADVLTRSPAQADISIRGASFNQVVVLVDGIRVSDIQSGHYDLDLAVPRAQIERIEILRGMGSALYGSDAIGGVVNIVTRGDASGARSLEGHGGSFGSATGSAATTASLGEARSALAFDVDRSDGHRAGTDFRAVQGRGSIVLPTSIGRLSADLATGDRHFGAADFYSPYPSDETTRTSTASLRLMSEANARVSLDAALDTRRHSDVFTLKRDEPAYYQNQHLSWQTGGEFVARAFVLPGLVVAGGTEFLDARLTSARLGDHVEERGAAFGEMTFSYAGATVDAGLRRDHSSAVGDFTSPSLAIAVPLGNAAQLHGTTGTGFRAPTWTERYYVDPSNIGDSTLNVERFRSSEIGLRSAPLRWLSGDVVYFERHATSLIDFARPVGATASMPWRTMNFASASYRGVEASLRLPSVFAVDWTVRASGLDFNVDAAPGTVGKYALRPITRTVGLSALTTAWEGRTLSVDALRARRVGENDHLLVNARETQSLRDITLSCELRNATNSDYIDGAGKPVAGRAVYAGISWAAR
jgi:iron complex outermembrane receptor protein